MSDSEHQDSSHNWLTFFFVCFAITVLGIALFGIYLHGNSTGEEGKAEPSGGHGMVLPADMKKLPHFYLPVA